MYLFFEQVILLFVLMASIGVCLLIVWSARGFYVATIYGILVLALLISSLRLIDTVEFRYGWVLVNVIGEFLMVILTVFIVGRNSTQLSNGEHSASAETER